MPFAVGKFEVTFAEWGACVVAGSCAHRPVDRGWGRGRQPVINVNWDDAQQYVAQDRQDVPALERGGVGVRGAGWQRARAGCTGRRESGELRWLRQSVGQQADGPRG